MIGTRHVVHPLLPADRLGSLSRCSFAQLAVLHPTLSGQVGSFHVQPYCHGPMTRARSPVHQGWSERNLWKHTLTELGRRGLQNFCHPRTDPVVIMLVTNETGDKIILGRSVRSMFPSSPEHHVEDSYRNGSRRSSTLLWQASSNPGNLTRTRCGAKCGKKPA